MSRSPHLFVRVNTGGGAGLGHFVRCIALAQEWIRRGGCVTFFLGGQGTDLDRYFASLPVEVVFKDAAFTEAEFYGVVQGKAGEVKPDFVVLDGYDFTIEDHTRYRSLNAPLLIIDDYAHLESYNCDLLLNQNPGSDELLYNFVSDTKKLLGLEFVLLRQPFVTVSSEAIASRKNSARRNLLVSFGGSDERGLTLPLVSRFLERCSTMFRVFVVIGAANPKAIDIRRELKSRLDCIQIIENCNDLSPYMKLTDLAIIAAGSIAWELASFGVPMLLFETAENQVGVATGVAAAKAGINLKTPTAEALDMAVTKTLDLFENDMLGEMRQAARKLVDGKGAGRVVDTMIGMMGSNQ